MQGSAAAAGLSTELREFLQEKSLLSLAQTFASEQVSLSELRRKAEDPDDFRISMRSMNVPPEAIKVLSESLRPAQVESFSLTTELVEASSAAHAALAAMAKAQAQQKPAASSVLGSDILAAALGKAAAVKAPKAPPKPEPVAQTPLHFSQTDLSYDSWVKLGKTGGVPPQAPQVNAALLAYQARGAADRSVTEDAAYGLASKETQLVLHSEAIRKQKEKPKGWFA